MSERWEARRISVDALRHSTLYISLIPLKREAPRKELMTMSRAGVLDPADNSAAYSDKIAFSRDIAASEKLATGRSTRFG
jgi:hypothetical protein